MKNQHFVFGKMNYILLFAGLALIAIGYLLMMGGGAENPAEFNPEIFSTTRVTIAPAILVLGFVVEIFAIMWSPKSNAEESAE